MGSSFSTPSPVKALIGQFDRLQLCSKEKKRVDDDTSESSKAPVVSQPTSSSVTDTITVSTATPFSLDVSTMSEITQEQLKKGDSYNDVPEENCVVPASSVKKSGDMRTGEDFLVLLESVRSRLEASTKQVLAELDENSLSGVIKHDMRTGEDFLVLLESVRSRLEASTKQVLAELDEMKSIPEEAASSIRLAAGKAQLLVRKKLSKFDELVKKNLNPVDGDLQPATIDDLEGYWALVEIELNDIDECFQKYNNNNIAKKKIVTTRPATVPIDPEVRAKQVEKQKAAAEMRRKALAEAKQKARAAQQAEAATAENDVSAPPRSDVLMVLRHEPNDNSSSNREYAKKSSNKEKVKKERVVLNAAYEESVSMEVEEMSDEMVAFFKKTIEHRKTRDAERTEKEQRLAKERGEGTAHWIHLDDDEYVLADKIGVYGVEKRTFAVPDEETRTKERRDNARKLYGSKAEQILAMETLMDMRFEQEYARKRPPLWPNIPLKL
ncbi:guanylate-kinase-associated protein [Ostertagia ostertagi]